MGEETIELQSEEDKFTGWAEHLTIINYQNQFKYAWQNQGNSSVNLKQAPDTAFHRLQQSIGQRLHPASTSFQDNRTLPFLQPKQVDPTKPTKFLKDYLGK